MMASGINLVMTVIGFSMSTMFIVFICTRLICARIQLSASRRSFRAASRSDLGLLERGLQGLEPGVLANFPTKNYTDECFSAAEDAQCIVCLSEYRGEDLLRILPYCGHFFHVTCIDIWLQQHSTCPVCRISVRELPATKCSMQPLFCSAVRSHYNASSLDVHYYSCVMAQHGHSSRINDSHRMDLVREAHSPAENGADAAGNVSQIVVNHLPAKELGNKHVESPSNG